MDFISFTLGEDTLLPVGDRGIKFSRLYGVEFWKSGGVKLGRLVGDTDFSVLGSDFVFKDEIEFWESGGVKRGYLSGDYVIGIDGYVVYVCSFINFYESGYLECCCLSDVVYLSIGDNVFNFAGGEFLYFHDGGDKVKSGVLGSPAVVGGIAFKGEVEFYGSGVFKRGWLVADVVSFEVGGLDVKFMYEISFHESGGVCGGVLFEDTYFRVKDKDILFKGGKYIEFDEGGIVVRGAFVDNVFLDIGDREVCVKGGSSVIL